LAWNLLKVILQIAVPVLLTIWYSTIFSSPLRDQVYFFGAVGGWIFSIVGIIALDEKLKKGLRFRQLEELRRSYEKTNYRLTCTTRIIEHLETIGRTITNRVFSSLESAHSDPLASLREALSFELCITDIITEIYSFYHEDPKRLPEQFFRVAFMVPENDENMKIAYHQTPGGIEPISRARNYKFSKENGTCAGYVWMTKRAYLIDDVEKYLKERDRQDRHFRYIHEEQEKDLKAIFCVPVYEEPKEGGPFYGVLCVDTNKPGWFSYVGGEKPVDYHIEIIKSFLKRIIYTKKLESYL